MGNQNSKVLVWVIIEYSSLYCKQDHKRCFEWKCGSECGNWYLQVSGRINPLMTETGSWSIHQTSIQKNFINLLLVAVGEGRFWKGALL